MIVLSHVVTVAIVSTPTRCCSWSAMLSASMWVRAFSRGCTTMSPMPWDWNWAAACSASPAQPPAGGVIAAPTTNWRVASCSARLPADGRSWRSGGAVATAAPLPGLTWRGRTASAAALMCVGVVPQQPPTIVTPASAKRPR